MAYVEIRRATPLSPEEAFARLTDWEAHRVPFTKIRRTRDGFTARTGIFGLGFDDPMEIVRFEPPRRVKIIKRGRVVRGWALLKVEPASEGGGSTVLWKEDMSFPFTPTLIERIGARWMLEHLLDGLLGSNESWLRSPRSSG